MSFTVFLTLLSDCLLAVVLFFLFRYVASISRSVHGILTWGTAHLIYTVGATLFDAGTTSFKQSGHPQLAALCSHVGALMACTGAAALAWSIIRLVRRQPLKPLEYAMVPLAAVAPLLIWVTGGDWEHQSLALNITSVVVLAVMVWHLRKLRADPYRLPARMMLVGCSLLILLYGSSVAGWSFDRFGFDEMWVSTDLSIWFMLNFCMLMLTSFRAAESLKLSAMFDPLTGALNRRGLHAELSQSLVNGETTRMGVIVLDLDHFKAINDRHGHETGDRVLQRFSDTVRSCLEDSHLFARMGGEEFAIVTTQTDPASLQLLAEQIRQQVMRMVFAASPAFQITVSLGLAAASGSNVPVNDLLRQADEAMYRAKRNGRNRIEMQPATG